MKVSVKGHIRDLLAFRRLVTTRRKRISKASTKTIKEGAINRLTEQLHPKRQSLIITNIRNETSNTKTFRLVPDTDSGTKELAFFRAGQYISLKIELNGNGITRPYSISSAPYESLGANGFYEVTIQRRVDGFFTPYVWDNWAVGTRVQSSGPCGEFYHESIRDAKNIVAIAGGSGITPFFSMAKEIINGNMETKLLILYGSNKKDEIVYKDLLQELEEEAPNKLEVVHVINCDEVPPKNYEQGLITADIIKKYSNVGDSSFFICGPQAMVGFVMKELKVFDLPRRRIRREVYGEIKDITKTAGFPREVGDKVFKIKVCIGNLKTEISAQANESVLVAMERAGLAPPSQCRSGECGVCRALLLSGEVYIHPENDSRRAADKRFGYIHPCVCYPITNLEISVPRGCIKMG